MLSNLIVSSKKQERVFSDLSEFVPLFHSPDGERYGVIQVNGHRETWSLESTVFRNLLDFKFYQLYGNLMPVGEINQIIRLLKAKAQFEAPEIPVFVRVAFYNGSIYLDLCNEKWEVVKITPNGWRVVQDPPVRFTRARGMLALPHPQKGGNLDALRKLINAQDIDIWYSCLSWTIASLNPKGPFPILNVEGGSGRAKSTAVRMIRHLVDPSIAPLRSAPNSVRDLMIASKDSWILAFDNLSKVPDWFSDALCRLATGGGFSTRKLFTDGEQFIVNTMRPIVINGIEFLPAREDFMDRSLVITLPQIPNDKRMAMEDLWTDFEVARPRILGALLDVISSCLLNLNKVELKSYPRMADFIRWVTASESTIGLSSGTFLKNYEDNHRSTTQDVLERDKVASLLQTLLASRKSWRGTATALLEELENCEPDPKRRGASWPKSASELSGRLKRVENNLLSVGIEIIFIREGGTGRRIIKITSKP